MPEAWFDFNIIQSSCSVIVYQHIISGTTYIVAATNGNSGWQIIAYGTVAGTVINSAIGTGNREVCMRAGTYNISVLLTPVTGLHIHGEGREATILSLTADLDAIFKTTVSTEFVTIEHMTLRGNKATRTMGRSIELYTSNKIHMGHLYITDFMNEGIRFDTLTDPTRGQSCFIYNTWIFGNNGDGIYIGAYANNVHVYETVVEYNGGKGIQAYGGNVDILGCIVCSSTSDNIIVSSVLGRIIDSYIEQGRSHGIRLQNTHDIIIHGCTIWDNSRAVAGASDAIQIATCYGCIVTGNTILSINVNQHRTGVRLVSTSTYNNIDDNRITLCLTGIAIVAAADANNRIGFNNLTGNTTLFSDAGTGTKLPSIILPFVDGTTSITADGAPKGWEIDAATEFAIAYGVMPPYCQQSIRIKVWAVGLAAPGVGNQMRIDLTANAGQPDEAYDAEAISVASKESNETNFTINDIISWTFTATNDVDIDDLIAGDCIEVKMVYRAAVAPDIETDALLRCVEIQYV